MKQKTAHHLNVAGEGVGDIWTWIAIDPESKIVPTFAVGDRSQYMANCFIEDLAGRLCDRVQISAEPALFLCLLEPVAQVGVDLFQAGHLGWVNAEEGASDTRIFMRTWGPEVTAAGPQRNFPQLEMREELVPFGSGQITVLFTRPLGPAAGDKRPMMGDHVFGVDRLWRSPWWCPAGHARRFSRRCAGTSRRKSCGVKTVPANPGSVWAIRAHSRCRARTTVPAAITAGPPCPGRWKR